MSKGLIDVIPGVRFLGSLVGPAFLRNVVIVMSGTAIAQLISFAFSPVLSRLYTPADFGVFGTYLSVTLVVGAGVTLNYVDTIMLPRDDRDAAPLFLVSCLATGLVTVGTAVFVVAAPGSWLQALELRSFGHWVWLVPLSVLLLGLSQSLASWCARVKAFSVSSKSQVVRSAVACAAQAGGGVAKLGGLGLIGGGVVADAALTVYLGRTTFAQSGPVFRSALRGRVLAAKAREFREFAIYGTPQNVMNALSQGLPVLALAHYYGAAVAGFYAFGIRLLQVPMNFILTSVRQVLYQRLSHISATGGGLYSPFFKATGGLALVCIVPSVISFIVAPALFEFIFGVEWRTAGEYGRWLILWLAPAFCNVPSTLALRILRQQRSLFFFDVALLGARITTLVLGGRWLSALHTVIAISVVGLVFNTVLIIYCGSRLRKLRDQPVPREPQRERPAR